MRDREKEVETECASSLGGSQDRDVSEGSESAAAAVGEDEDGPRFSDDEKQETEGGVDVLLSVCLSICFSVFLYTSLSLSVYLPVCLSVFLLIPDYFF